MNRINRSYNDLIVCGFAIFVFGTAPAGRDYLAFPIVAVVLICGLKFLPRSSTLSRVIAICGGCFIFIIEAVLIFSANLSDDRHDKAVMELAVTATALCVSLWNWHDARVEVNATPGQEVLEK